MRYWAAVLIVLIVVPLCGCARGGATGGVTIPDLLARFFVTFAGPIDDTSYYFIAIDTDDDFGGDGPLPVAAGPFWGNGWGTGSMTHFIAYHQGRYDVFEANREVELEAATGGITAAVGSPVETDTGDYDLTTTTVNLGAATPTGTGPVTAVANVTDQNAGVFSMDTDAAGATVAGTVSFTPAVVGGRTLTAPEQAGLDALNAGGVTLAADSLAAFGLTLTVGPPATGTQAITVDPTVADIGVRFQANSGATQRVSTGTLTANTSTPTATPPIPGVSIAAGTILPGATASIRSQISPTATQIGPPYDSNQPFNSTSLDVTLDLAQIGAGLDDLSVNIIATTELIFDPIITDPAVNVYDALGVQGNDYVTFATTQTRTIINGDLFTPEGRGDPTLRGPATDAEVNAVDIVNWSVTIQRLGN